MIDEPGIYDMDEATYNADPCADISLRSSIASKLVDRGSTPRHAWFACPRLNPDFKPDNRRMFDLGKACHAALLGKGSKLLLIKEDSYRSKMAKELRDAAYALGEIPLLEYEAAQVFEMADAARQQLGDLVAAGTLSQMPFAAGETEKTLVWRDRGVTCRARLDGLPSDGETLFDYKTTAASADPALWQFRQFRVLGYDFQLAFYRRGLEALGIAHSPTFGCIVQEVFEPYLLSFVRVDDEVIARADEKVSQALRIWKRCLERNEWPGYDVNGYTIELTERERMAEAQETAKSTHVYSDDIEPGAGDRVLLRPK